MLLQKKKVFGSSFGKKNLILRQRIVKCADEKKNVDKTDASTISEYLHYINLLLM